MKNKNLWQGWEEEVEKFKNVLNEYPPPAGIIRQWRRHLLFIFMKEISKNVLNEQETIYSLIGRIIEAIRVGCGFECVRVYLVDEKEKKEMYLHKTSDGHDPIEKEKLRLKIKKGIDTAVDTLFSGEPLLLEDAADSKLVFGEYLNLKGPYVAIPLIVEKVPIGLICANTSYKAEPEKSIVKHPDYFENIDTFARNVMAAIENRQIFGKKNELLLMRDSLLEMLKNALREAYSLNSVLEIIRDSCYNLKVVRDIETVCLSIKDPFTKELTTPSVKCVREDRDCNSCFKENRIIQDAFRKGETLTGKNDLAFPISLESEAIGVLYFQGNKKIILTDEEEEFLKIITNTAAILIKTARDYEKKIKQSAALYELGKLSTKTRNFKEWFSPLMERVMDIIGRENRNFHLVTVEEVDGKEKLFIKVTSPIIKEKKAINLEEKLLNLELPMEESLAGMVVKEKVFKYISDVEENERKSDDDPGKLKYHDDKTGIKAEATIPLKIKEGDSEKVIAVLIIDSTIANDLNDIDWEFIETIANHLAITIHNQQLYEERTNFQIELSRTDRTTELTIFLNSFFHDIKNPVSEMNSAINLIDMYSTEAAAKTYIQKAKDLSHRILYTYDQFVNNFAKSISKRETKQLKELIENALTTIEKTVGLGGELKGNFKESDVVITCFPAYIELAFRSIINNAFKFSSGLQPKDRYLEINVEPNKRDNSVLIFFESSTIEYLSGDKLKTIFKPFEDVITRESSGGLGLSLAELCIKLHRGDIIAVNVASRKSVRFEIKLPMDRIQRIGE